MMTPNGDARAGLFDIRFQLLGGIRGNILRHHARTGRQQRFRGGQQAAHVLQLPEQGVPMLADTAQFNIKTFGVSCFQAYFLRVLSVMRAGVLRRVPSEARDLKGMIITQNTLFFRPCQEKIVFVCVNPRLNAVFLRETCKKSLTDRFFSERNSVMREKMEIWVCS